MPKAAQKDDMTFEEFKRLIWAPPFDPRFPSQNQTRNCYTNYLDYHRCQKAKGENYEPCSYFKRVYEQMCPSDWTEKWDEQRANGTFAGKI